MAKELSPETQFMVKVFGRKPEVTFKEMKALAEKAVAKGKDLDLSKIIPVTYGVAKRAAGLTQGKKPGPKPKNKVKDKPTTVSAEPVQAPASGNGVMSEINRLVSEHEKLKALVTQFIGQAQAIISSPEDEEEEVPF